MKRDISMELDGKDLVQTTTYHDDKGAFERESVSRLGNRDAVLGHFEEQTAEAKRALDGLSAPATAKPPPPADGTPGVEVSFWLDGRNVCRCEVRRDAKGKVASVQSRKEGLWAQRLENAQERFDELAELLDKATKAT